MKKLTVILFVAFLTGCASTPPVSVIDIAAIRLKADAGDLTAMFFLAGQYDKGRTVPLDKKEAAKWYLRSAEGGLVEAQNSIGSMYQAGDGVQKDYLKARTWYEKAADQNNLEATHNLAYIYDEGLGVPEDNAKAIALYKKAAEQGYATSMLNLGVMYKQGDGVAASDVEAYKWFDLARFYTQSSQDMRLKWRVRGSLDEMKAKMPVNDVKAAENLALQWNRTYRGSQ